SVESLRRWHWSRLTTRSSSHPSEPTPTTVTSGWPSRWSSWPRSGPGRTVASRQRRGVASALLRHILSEAKRRGYTRLSLETGSMAYFEPARSLYRKFGFKECPPFADYVDDPNSVYMTLEL